MKFTASCVWPASYIGPSIDPPILRLDVHTTCCSALQDACISEVFSSMFAIQCLDTKSSNYFVIICIITHHSTSEVAECTQEGSNKHGGNEKNGIAQSVQ